MISCCTISSSVSLTMAFSATRTLRGACCTGSTVSSSLMRYTTYNVPMPWAKTFENFARNWSLVTGSCYSVSCTAYTGAPLDLPVFYLSLSRYPAICMHRQAFLPSKGPALGLFIRLQSSSCTCSCHAKH